MHCPADKQPQAVEFTQLFDRNAFDVAPVADRRLAIVVPLVRRGHHPLREDPRGRVFAPFEFVADHRHFGRQVFSLDEAVDHPIRFEADGKFQVVVGGREASRNSSCGRPTLCR